jgi:predicted PurR-regulated permease PerM
VGLVNPSMRIKGGMTLLAVAGAWLMLWVLGIDFALPWPILTFLLYFIPVAGGIVMVVPPVRKHRALDDP